VMHNDALVDILQPRLKTQPAAHWLTALEKAGIRRIVPVDLPRPRDPTTPEFTAYVRLVLGEIHDDLTRLGAH